MEENKYNMIEKEVVYDILIDYDSIQDKLHQLLVVLNALGKHYNCQEYKETYANLSVIVEYLRGMQKEFVKIREKTDKLL